MSTELGNTEIVRVGRILDMLDIKRDASAPYDPLKVYQQIELVYRFPTESITNAMSGSCGCLTIGRVFRKG